MFCPKCGTNVDDSYALSVVLIFLNLISQKILHSKIIIKLLLKMDITMISIAAC